MIQLCSNVFLMRPENECIIYVPKPQCSSDVDPNAISSKYSIYTLANTGNNGDPITSPSCRYILNSILK